MKVVQGVVVAFVFLSFGGAKGYGDAESMAKFSRTTTSTVEAPIEQNKDVRPSEETKKKAEQAQKIRKEQMQAQKQKNNKK